jgi:hypothetical protein
MKAHENLEHSFREWTSQNCYAMRIFPNLINSAFRDDLVISFKRHFSHSWSEVGSQIGLRCRVWSQQLSSLDVKNTRSHIGSVVTYFKVFSAGHLPQNHSVYFIQLLV